MLRYSQRFGDAPIMYHVARLFCWFFRWKVVGVENLPPDPKAIGIVAPHTSGWDVWMMYVMAYKMRIKANWLAKDVLLRPPFAWFFRPMGAIPVDRSKSSNLVDQVADSFDRYDSLYLAIAPEGTRAKTERWRTGFYHIAMKANVGIMLMFVDYAKREVGFGPFIKPTGDIDADFEIIKDFYSKVTPKHPKRRSLMVLSDKGARKPDAEGKET